MAVIVSSMDPVKLAGLKQADYIMHCLVEGRGKAQIVRALNGDDQLVTIWISFLKHNHWMVEVDGIWTTTAKGLAWSRAISSRKVLNG